MNPLMQVMGSPSSMMGGINPQAIQQIKQMMGAFKAVQNPQAALQMMAQQNPQVSAVMQMCQGKNPQAVFEEQCKAHGLDPGQAMQQIKGMISG